MTKKAMVEIIEKSEMVINFSKSYFMRLDKASVERFYNQAIQFMERK